jgi:formamidopyrimidine-DNA glycosylase
MPELPEMENYKRLLNQKIAGQVITAIEINREKSVNVNPKLFINSVQHQLVITVDRRGKHLLFHLQNGQVLLLHLMLGGWMFYGLEADKPHQTIQVRLSFGETHLYFIGLRLGYLHLYSEKDVHQQLLHLGPEPLTSDFTLEQFLKIISHMHGRLKPKLLNQEFIAGIGNCYSDEICYHARVKPTRNINELSDSERKQIYHSIHQVLLDAIRHGGYMENPFCKGDTLTGGYDDLCQVYDCEGEKCKRCGAIIIKEMISSRKTFYCMNCQI